MMEPDAAEETRVAKDESAFRLVEDEMVVVLGTKSGGLDAEFASHPEMKAEPVASRELEQHLFSPRFGADKSAAGEFADDGTRIRTAENPFLTVELDLQDFVSKSGVPLSAKKFDFGELGHGEKML